MKKSLLSLCFIFVAHLSIGQQTMGLFLNDSTSFNGYTLIMPFNSNDTYLIDNCGYIVNSWNKSNHWHGAVSYLDKKGNLVKTGRDMNGNFLTGGSGGFIEIFDWDDNLLWSYTFSNSQQQQHHDIEILPNGNILVLSFDYRSRSEAISAGRDSNLVINGIWSEKIVELKPVGIDSAEIIWEWYLWDHLVQDYDSTMNNFTNNLYNHPELINLNYTVKSGTSEDWIHCNSIDYNVELDQIMLSALNFNELWVIDHSTTTQEAAGHTGGNIGKGGDIIYRWGNPSAYRKDKDDNQIFYGQHDAHWIPKGLPNEGAIMVYNNGLDFPQFISRVQILKPPVDSAGNYALVQDSSFLPYNVNWSYTTPNYSDFVSGAQQLPNGNILVCDGPKGEINEIDSAKNIVWTYQNPVGLNSINTQGNYPSNSSIFRAYRYAPDFEGFNGKFLVPTVPIELNPIAYDCTIYADTLTFTEEIRTVEMDVQIRQNPIVHQLVIDNNQQRNLTIQVYNMMGQPIFQSHAQLPQISIPASEWSNGAYLVLFHDIDSGQSITKKFIKINP